MTTQSDIQDNLPLTEATFFIMLSLTPEPKHGYAIMKDSRSLSDNRVVLSTGTLYGTLKRLLEQGWIEQAEDLESNEIGRPRKVYALTHLGQRVFECRS
jgi:DNA-binding PadR family transcriptional regulator